MGKIVRVQGQGLTVYTKCPECEIAFRVTAKILQMGSASLGSTGYVIVETISAIVNKYSKPKLRVYGSVGQLTQAGTGLSSEVMANGMASMSPNQRA